MLYCPKAIDMELTTLIPKFISHIRKSATGEIYVFQSNEEHLNGVARLAEL